jgi:hypothetical protein
MISESQRSPSPRPAAATAVRRPAAPGSGAVTSGISGSSGISGTAGSAGRPGGSAGSIGGAATLLADWISGQSLNVIRHAAALRPFRRSEFATGATGIDAAAAPSDGHIQAANRLVGLLRRQLFALTRRVRGGAAAALERPSPERLARLLADKERAHDLVRATERIWDFYFELFGQRQSRFANWLLSCDRIALDCYQAAYLGLGVARSIPAPPPFAYMRTGFSPATYRRGIPLRRLGRQLNPFPLVQLPYHRLVNPWTLGAVLHEVCHNLQNDLGLARAVPAQIASAVLGQGLDARVARVWTRWNREIFADLGGLLLGGPAVLGSLLDVIGRGPGGVVTYVPNAPHPTMYLRPFLSIELLRRLGFRAEAESYARAWTRLYPDPSSGNLPAPLLSTFPRAVPAVVDAICFTPYPSLGGKSLADAIRFGAKEQQMIEEAARRLAAGVDPGIIPARFLIGAVRQAFERRLARPGVLSRNFYLELARR